MRYRCYLAPSVAIDCAEEPKQELATLKAEFEHLKKQGTEKAEEARAEDSVSCRTVLPWGHDHRSKPHAS